MKELEKRRGFFRMTGMLAAVRKQKPKSRKKADGQKYKFYLKVGEKR